MTDRSDSRLVKLATLWERTSGKGRKYFSGFLGDAQLLMFEAGEITRPNGEVVQTWKLLVQERDPARRPQRHDRPPAHDAQRGVATGQAVQERADGGSAQQREEYTQELADRFDQRGEDEVPW
jgi:hypothetical protein